MGETLAKPMSALEDVWKRLEEFVRHQFGMPPY